ncbi:MAG: hypothetical protein J6V66_06345 [Clostridia bacterium]|nr:hypothetical protein [Clostridia bacterium]
MFSFFKKKPKFTHDQVDQVLMNGLSEWEGAGIVPKNERNDENWAMTYTPTEYSRGINVKSTINGITFSFSVFFSMDDYEAQLYMTFYNIGWDKKYKEQSALRSRYPLHKFTYNYGNISIDTMTKNNKGDLVYYKIKCKTLEDIYLAAKEFGKKFADSNMYNYVMDLNNGKGIN